VSLADDLRDLEVSMLSTAARYSKADLERLLTEDFVEFGGSGVVYDRAALIDVLMAEGAQIASPIAVSDLVVKPIGTEAALITYRTIRDGQVRLRSSLWRREGREWRMMFHQATPAAS